MTFVHLNVHSKASMLYGSADIKELVSKAKELGQPAIALTDYSNLFNAIRFYTACKEAGVKPILGVDVLFCDDVAESKSHKIRQAYHLTLLAENEAGWKNIARLVSMSQDPDHFYYRPRIDFDALEKYKEGVICLSGSSLDGAVSYYLYDKVDAEGFVREAAGRFRAEAMVRRFVALYGTENFFLETQDTGNESQPIINERLRTIATKYGLQTVATGNVHYVKQSDAEAHKTLLAMDKNKYNKASGSVFDEEEFYVKSEDELLETDLTQEELDAAATVAGRCNVEIDVKKRRLPKYKFVPEGHTSVSYLRELANAGLYKDMGLESVADTTGDEKETYQERLDRELADIEEMGFADYFLIVHDVISWVHSKGIIVGPGRGSAGGSLVSCALGITEIDPLKYGLIWERFLNKGRGGLPDIDTDVPRSKRQAVLAYVRERFGTGNVAQLVTFNGLQARAVLKDVFHVFDMPFDEANRITALVPAKGEDHTQITLAAAIEKVPELQEYEKKYGPWFKIARALEGCYKSTGLHAAAVVISDEPFEDSAYPLTRSRDGSMIFGWDMGTVDSLSLLKLDILGLTTLDDIQVTRELVEKRHGITLTRKSMPLDDPKTYHMLGQGFTNGIFQIEKQLGRTWSKNLEPKSIGEISDLVSLIRPGPLDCLAPITKILVGVHPKRYKTVEELHLDGTKDIISVDEDSHVFVSNKIVRVVQSGEKELFKVHVTQRIEGDYSEDTGTQARYLDIIASQDHKFLTHDGWKRLKDIIPGQYVAILNYRYGRSTRKNKSAAGYKNFRNVAFNHYVNKCLFCDWHDGSLDVNHVVGNRHTDNSPDNLCFLCPNHHRVFGEGNISIDDIRVKQKAHRLPFTEDVIYVRFDGIESMGKEDTYDIEVKGPWHNFIAGGFVVHNSGMHNQYRSVKMKGEDPVYIHDMLIPILKDTHSGLLYQEQVIEICKQIAGMSLIDSDKVRKAMGKKKPEEMRKWKSMFVTGAMKSGVDEETAGEIWNYIEVFAGYGFNKSHGVGYALLAYETAFLKANYTTEFLCAKLRHADGDYDKLSALVYDAKLFEIEVTPPRVSAGNKDFDITGDQSIAFGLAALKGVGRTAVDDLMRHAKKCGTVDDVLWLLATNKTKVNSAVITALIRGGAFDDWQEHRIRSMARYRLIDGMTPLEVEAVNTLREQLPEVVDWTRFVRSLSDEIKAPLIKEKYGVKIPNVRRRERIRSLLQDYDAEEIFDNKAQRIAWEKHYLGISLSGSESDIYKSQHKCVDLIKSGEPDMAFEIAVCIDSVKEIVTKKGDPMAFLTVHDDTYAMDNVVVFPRQFEKAKKLLESGNVIRIRGKQDDRGSLLANTITRLT